jgi:AraC-like DNA-binding protein
LGVTRASTQVGRPVTDGTLGAAASAVPDGVVPTGPEPLRLEVAGTDPEAAVRDLAGVYAGKQWVARRTEGDFAYRYTAIGDTEVSMRRSRMTGSLRGGSAPGEDLVVHWITAGSGTQDIVRDRVPLRLDQPSLFPTERPFVFVAAEYDQQLVHLDRSFVRAVAAERYEVADRALRFDHLRQPDPEAVRAWRESLGSLARALRAGGPDSLVWHEAKHATAAAFLRLVPPQLDELPADLLHPRNARVRAAVEYIHAHPETPITISELAAVAGLSVRSVQESFQRTFGTSPLSYLRQVRLDRVREELLDCDPRQVSVGEVARRWGFAHLGRFSAVYAERFGEYPKQTLRR